MFEIKQITLQTGVTYVAPVCILRTSTASCGIISYYIIFDLFFIYDIVPILLIINDLSIYYE